MCHRAETTLPRAAAAVSLAREWTRLELALMYGRLDAAAQDVELVVSELVTNAIRAGPGFLALAIDAHQARVRVSVSDDAPGVPVLQTPAVDAGGGRGLQIVAALGLGWGVLPEARGKIVWADLPVPGSAAPTFTCTDSARA